MTFADELERKRIEQGRLTRDPYRVRCPRCGMPPGEACHKLSGVRRGGRAVVRAKHPHPERRAKVGLH